MAIALAALAAACTSILAIKDPTLDDGGGGGSDAAIDSRIDAPIDAAIDAAIDGPPAVCTTGACCSPTGQFEPQTKVCDTTTEFQCASQTGTTSCGAQPQQRMVQTFCPGTSETCTGSVMPGNFTNMGPACGADQLCAIPNGAPPQCTACSFGCDPTANACRPVKLFLLLSVGGFQGGFFGTRAAFDARCAADYADRTRFPDRGCNPSHAHAVISVNSADSMALMASKFSIPLGVPLHRVDDDAFVTGTWNNLIDSTLTLTAAPSSLPPGSANALVWTGFNGLDCTGWSSSSNGVSGDRGDTASATALRLNAANTTCNLTGHLLCVCWSGP
jgi:hypothetical protein